MYSTKAPVFMGGFKGNIRAINGATIALRVSPESWLPAGSQWIKDDISRITGQ
ncbi:MAG: hypothetical protein LIP23_05325 [Planctomycetes bacterium]|nr:hypothetical protein [Planctomycetota bacterium]